ncbi:MAG: methyltransferase domain-containing protein [Phycisphaeraceae bacterium]
MTQATGLDKRLAREMEHFEKRYAEEAARGIEPLSDFDRRRYTNPPADTIYPREFFYHLLAPLEGKDTLEIACGNGIDAAICAHNGANVHAYDLSSRSIEMVRRRAEVNGLADRMKLQVTADLSQAFCGQTFDRIMGYAALHHIPLEGLAQRVYDRLRPGGMAVFAEPVINSKALHALRRCVPYYIFEPTEDEQPLNDHDIARFARPFDRMVRREFQLTARLWPLFPNNWPLAVALHRLDAWLLKLPFMRRFATVVVFGLYRDR